MAKVTWHHVMHLVFDHGLIWREDNDETWMPWLMILIRWWCAKKRTCVPLALIKFIMTSRFQGYLRNVHIWWRYNISDPLLGEPTVEFLSQWTGSMDIWSMWLHRNGMFWNSLFWSLLHKVTQCFHLQGTPSIQHWLEWFVLHIATTE